MHPRRNLDADLDQGSWKNLLLGRLREGHELGGTVRKPGNVVGFLRKMFIRSRPEGQLPYFTPQLMCKRFHVTVQEVDEAFPNSLCLRSSRFLLDRKPWNHTCNNRYFTLACTFKSFPLGLPWRYETLTESVPGDFALANYC